MCNCISYVHRIKLDCTVLFGAICIEFIYYLFEMVRTRVDFHISVAGATEPVTLSGLHGWQATHGQHKRNLVPSGLFELLNAFIH